MILYLFILIIVAISFFFIGMSVGINKGSSIDQKKNYKIEFKKLTISNQVIKSSVLINRIVNFCDSIGIEIIDIDINDWGNGEINVKCNKDQHFLFIQELSRNENMIEIKKINF